MIQKEERQPSHCRTVVLRFATPHNGCGSPGPVSGQQLQSTVIGPSGKRKKPRHPDAGSSSPVKRDCRPAEVRRPAAVMGTISLAVSVFWVEQLAAAPANAAVPGLRTDLCSSSPGCMAGLAGFRCCITSLPALANRSCAWPRVWRPWHGRLTRPRLSCRLTAGCRVARKREKETRLDITNPSFRNIQPRAEVAPWRLSGLAASQR